jgi:hypothetical protein
VQVRRRRIGESRILQKLSGHRVRPLHLLRTERARLPVPIRSGVAVLVSHQDALPSCHVAMGVPLHGERSVSMRAGAVSSQGKRGRLRGRQPLCRCQRDGRRRRMDADRESRDSAENEARCKKAPRHTAQSVQDVGSTTQSISTILVDEHRRALRRDSRSARCLGRSSDRFSDWSAPRSPPPNPSTKTGGRLG